MKQKITFLLVMMCLLSISTYAQTQFWSDTFEDIGAPSSGTRTPSIAEFSCGGPPATAYFMRTATSGINFQNGSYTAIEGSKFWAGEDIDRGPTCTNNSISANQQVTWSGINITGKTGLSFRGLFAASNLGGWQGIDWATSSQQDFLAFEYRIDGGPWVRALAFYSDVPLGSAASSNTLRLDTNNDMVGDGASLGLAFTDYSVNIVGTGTTLDIRMNCFANAGASQELAIDNFRLFEAPVCNVALTLNSQTNVSCNGGSNGAATVNTATGGTAPYTYNWTPGNPTGDGTTSVSGLTAGTWTCTVTDANSCTASQIFTITQPVAVVNGTTVVTNVACNSGTNGAINLTPSGGTPPYTYNWGGGITTEDRTGLAAGSYSVTITDANGCTGTVSGITITQPAALVATAIVDNNVSCNGGANGGATGSAIGGTPPYTYLWSNASTAASLTGVTAGTYNVTITDANGCTDNASITITQPVAIDNTISELTTGILTANEVSATSYQWYECPNILLSGETNQTFEPTALGNYKVEITVGACVVESACYTVNALGTSSFVNKASFVVYPNPSNGLLHIDSSFDGDFVIVNQLGQTVTSFKVNAGIENTINVENITDGVYFIKGTSGTQISSQRLIIKK